MPAITISSGYGTHGQEVAQGVADALEYPLLDRAISGRIAAELQVSPAEAEGGEIKQSFVGRFFGALAPMATSVVGGADLAKLNENDDAAYFRRHAEAIVREALPAGAVVHGRAGAAMLRKEPDVLRVRLYGGTKARAQHAAAYLGLTEQDAAHQLPRVDAARAHYVDRLYGRDIDDPDLYVLQLDSTQLPVPLVIQVIVETYHAFRGTAQVASAS